MPMTPLEEETTTKKKAASIFNSRSREWKAKSKCL